MSRIKFYLILQNWAHFTECLSRVEQEVHINQWKILVRKISYLGKIFIIPSYQNCFSLIAISMDIQSNFNFPNTSVWHQRCQINILYTYYIVFASGLFSTASIWWGRKIACSFFDVAIHRFLFRSNHPIQMASLTINIMNSRVSSKKHGC